MKRGYCMEYLHNDKEQFREAIALTGYQTGVAAEIIEKDYYVTMILRALAERLPFIVFKGGTSLSKCHKVIRRFSEDIDVSIDTSLSQSQKKKLKYALVEVVEAMGLEIPNLYDTRSRRDYNRYEIAYTSVSGANDETVKPTVLLETSYTAVSFPTVMLDVHNLIGDMMEVEAPEVIENYRLEPFQMKVQGLDRTLADKVFAVCDYYLQGKERKHSRHLYDIYKLLPLVPQDKDFKMLVNEVRKVRAESTICPSAKSDVIITELLKEIVDKEIYKADYEALTIRLLDDDVDYKTAISAIIQIAETDIYA